MPTSRKRKGSDAGSSLGIGLASSKRQLLEPFQQNKNTLPSCTIENNLPIPPAGFINPLQLKNLWMQCGQLSLNFKDKNQISSKCFENVLKYEPNNIEVINKLVDSLILDQMGLFKSIDLLNQLMNDYPEIRGDVRLWIKLSESYLKIGEFEKAHGVIMTALDFANKNPHLWLLLGKCLRNMKLQREAIDALTNTLYLLPKDLLENLSENLNEIEIARQVRLELSLIALNDGNLEHAKSELTSALSLPLPQNDLDKSLILNLASELIFSFDKVNDITNAISICETVENILPNDSLMLILHSIFLLNSNDSVNFIKARKLLTTALRYDSAYIESSNLLEYFNSSNGNYLTWLLLAESNQKLNVTDVMFDCLEIALRKIKNKSALVNLKIIANKLLEMVESSNVSLYNRVKFFIENLSDTQGFEPLDLKAVLFQEMTFPNPFSSPQQRAATSNMDNQWHQYHHQQQQVHPQVQVQFQVQQQQQQQPSEQKAKQQTQTQTPKQKQTEKQKQKQKKQKQKRQKKEKSEQQPLPAPLERDPSSRSITPRGMVYHSPLSYHAQSVTPRGSTVASSAMPVPMPMLVGHTQAGMLPPSNLMSRAPLNQLMYMAPPMIYPGPGPGQLPGAVPFAPPMGAPPQPPPPGAAMEPVIPMHIPVQQVQQQQQMQMQQQQQQLPPPPFPLPPPHTPSQLPPSHVNPMYNYY